jgi:hypothetical protein
MARWPLNRHSLDFFAKGMLTKLLRMLFPLGSASTRCPILDRPPTYPLMPGEMIYLPDMIAGIGDDKMARVITS